MKKLLLASVAVIALAGSPARAQIFGGVTVFDPSAFGQLLQEVGIGGQQLDQLVQTYTQVVNVYNMSQNIWHSVDELVGANNFAPGLTDPSLRNPMPFTAASHPAWVGGYNDPSGIPFGSTYLGQNTVGGDPTVYNDGTFAGSEIWKSINSLSSMQALATNHLQSIETRINALGDLFNQLASIGNIQETDSLSARLNTELNYANSQVSQAQQTMSAAQLQLSVQQNNQTQWQYLDELNGITAACGSVAQAGGFVTFAACNGAVPGGPGAPAGASITATSTVFVPGTSNPIATGG